MCRRPSKPKQQQQETQQQESNAATAPSLGRSSPAASTTSQNNDVSSFTSDQETTTNFPRRILDNKIYPLPPWVLVAVVPLMPSWCFLNRGFTQWFCWTTIAYWLTQQEWLVPFQILLGSSVTSGWYASLLYEYVVHGRCFTILYKNMPSILYQPLLAESNNNGLPLVEATLDVFQSKESIGMWILIHLLDLLIHPIQTYYFWKIYTANKKDQRRNQRQQQQQQQQQGQQQGQQQQQQGQDNQDDDMEDDEHCRRRDCSNQELFSWPVIVTSYLYSRLWSGLHSYYLNGSVAWFYIGHDVYVVNTVDSFYPSYIAESLVYISVVIYKLVLLLLLPLRNHKDNGNDGKTMTTTTTRPIGNKMSGTRRNDDDNVMEQQRADDAANTNKKRPELMYSESGASMESSSTTTSWTS